ncbi:uncharacterized protein LOC119367445 [Triticum dicoccoides]|uniref:uncharacterized protein LOC119367445 n=1 Tax=Triticum dicoccoides TaxID=85692 RepID=UPI00188DFBA6|nr:uncharacterized protein LOC119367445 [Triticum dicoccoides]
MLLLRLRPRRQQLPLADLANLRCPPCALRRTPSTSSRRRSRAGFLISADSRFFQVLASSKSKSSSFGRCNILPESILLLFFLYCMSSIVQPCWLLVDVVVILLLGGRGCELSCCLVEEESRCLY